MRTGLYFAMILISLAAMIAAGMLRLRLNLPLRRLERRLDRRRKLSRRRWSACRLALPGVNEVPEGFPAVVLWQFRLASLGAQMILWAILGLGFGAWTERAAVAENRLRLNPATR